MLVPINEFLATKMFFTNAYTEKKQLLGFT